MTLSETSTQQAIRYRLTIGPKWLADTDLAFFDWSGITYGATIPSYPDHVSAVQVGDIEPGDTTHAALVRGTGWPAKGGCWVRGSGTESWEYIEYTGLSTNALTGVRRGVVDLEQTGYHYGAGASQVITCRMFWPLHNDDGKLDVTIQMDNKLVIGSWELKVSGANAPIAALRNGHLAIVEISTSDGGNWTAWTVGFVGWLKNVKFTDSIEETATWSADIVGSDDICKSSFIPGIHSGDLDVALLGQASATSTMGSVKKITITDETIKAEPDVSPESAIDDDLTTFWASDRAVGVTNTPNAYGHAVDQIHISPRVGQAGGSRWIQFPAGPTQQTGWGMRLMNQSGWFAADGPGTMLVWNVPHPFGGDEYSPIILCESAEQFKIDNPDYGSAQIIEYPGEVTPGVARVWRKYDPGSGNYYDAGSDGMPAYSGQQWWDSLTPAAGGLLQNVISGVAPEPADGVTSIALWGTQTQVACEWPNAHKTWSGAVIPALAPGQTIRKIHSGSRVAATGWQVTDVSTPGYYMDSGQAIGWMVDLPRLELVLTSDITASVPGAAATLYLTKENAPSVNGLPDSGIIQIGNEQITYSAKTADQHGLVVTARGANSTTAAIHLAGDLIYFVDTGVATDGRAIKSISMTRAAGMPTWKRFTTYGSLLDGARDYATDGWGADWTVIDDYSGATPYDELSTYSKTFATPTRYRHFMVIIYEMYADPYWPIINSFSAYEDEATQNPNSTIAAGAAGEVLVSALRLCGIPATAISLTAGTMSVDNVTIATDNCLNILSDFCEYARIRLGFGWDSKIWIVPDPWWGVDGVPATTKTWTKSLSQKIDLSFIESNTNIGQVVLTWKLPDGSPGGIVKYPSDPGVYETENVGPLLFANAANALASATKRYWQIKRPFECLIPFAGAPWADISPGGFHRIQWLLDSTMLAYDRDYMLIGVDYRIKDNTLDTVGHFVQISRTDNK